MSIPLISASYRVDSRDRTPPAVNPFADLTDDLTVNQFQALLAYVWTVQHGRLDRATVKGFRRANGLDS